MKLEMREGERDVKTYRCPECKKRKEVVIQAGQAGQAGGHGGRAYWKCEPCGIIYVLKDGPWKY